MTANRPPPSQYIHGSDESEQRRLSTLNAFINDAFLREMDLRGGKRVVDFGSELEQFTRAMARAAGPNARVIGIERDAHQIAEAKRQAIAQGEAELVEFRQGDAYQPPLRDDEWNSFDVAHTRFLLEHVNDPLQVVRNMVRALRPDGRVILADDDHDTLRVWPELSAFDHLWRAYVESYVQLGNDPFIGRKLVALLSEAGATPVRNTMTFFGSCSRHELWNTVIDNMIGLFHTARRTIVESMATMTDAEFDSSIIEIKQWGRRPDAALWYGFCWAEGVKAALPAS